MADEGTQAGQEPPESKGQEPEKSGGDTGTGEGEPAESKESKLSPEQSQAALEAARKEAAAERKKRQAVESKLKAEEESKLSEQERTVKERDELKATLDSTTKDAQARLVLVKAEAVAARMGLVDPEVAAQLVASKIDLDDEGNPQGVQEALEALSKEKPWLAGQGAPAPGTSTSPGNPATGRRTGTLTRDQLSKMTPEDIAKLDRKEVDAALSAP